MRNKKFLFFIYYFFNRKNILLSTPIFLLCFGAAASDAQTAFGNASPNIQNVFASPPAVSDFKLNTITDCPVPSFSIGSFYNRASDNANPIILPSNGLNESSSSNLNNFGITAGVTVPLAGRLGKSCKDLFSAKARSYEITNKIETAKFQSQLVQECYYLYSLHINFDEPAFNEDGPSGALFPCRSIVKAIDPPPRPVSSSSPQPKVEPEVKDALTKGRESAITSPELRTTQNSQPVIILDDR